ncbi:MAG: hypothetical protein H2069_01665 [Legionella sp.]|nr:hypothetical protein [Legionella sp.]
MRIQYEKPHPALFISKRDKDNIEIWHDHPEKFDTGYLYNENLDAGQKATINNTINEQSAKIQGCKAFFNFFKSVNLKNPNASAIVSAAVAEDEAILKSLTQKNF